MIASVLVLQIINNKNLCLLSCTAIILKLINVNYPFSAGCMAYF